MKQDYINEIVDLHKQGFKVNVVVMGNGGCGKTTFSNHLAIELSKELGFDFKLNNCHFDLEEFDLDINRLRFLDRDLSYDDIIERKFNNNGINILNTFSKNDNLFLNFGETRVVKFNMFTMQKSGRVIRGLFRYNNTVNRIEEYSLLKGYREKKADFIRKHIDDIYRMKK